MQEYGPWKILKREQMYADPWLKVYCDQVTRPDGKPGTYSTVHLKHGICVIALDDDLTVHLTSEFHYAVGRVTLEGVSGGIESPEPPRSAAERELAEELGLEAKDWFELGQIDPFTGSIYSTVDLFLARGLTPCQRSPEGTEQIEPVTMPFSRCLDAFRNGEITHGPTCVAILRIALDFLS